MKTCWERFGSTDVRLLIPVEAPLRVTAAAISEVALIEARI
jgi:hypothetical protein